MKTYQINKFTNWNDIPILNIDVPYLETPSDITASAQISWNENSLLIHLSTRELQTRAEERGELAAPCKDSCLEFFISWIPPIFFLYAFKSAHLAEER